MAWRATKKRREDRFSFPVSNPLANENSQNQTTARSYTSVAVSRR